MSQNTNDVPFDPLVPNRTLPSAWSTIFRHNFGATGVALSGAALFLFSCTVWAAYGYHQKKEVFGQETTAQIVAKYSVDTEAYVRESAFFVIFYFQANGLSVEEEREVSQRFYAAHSVDDVVPVWYVAENPSTFALHLERVPTRVLWLLSLTILAGWQAVRLSMRAAGLATKVVNAGQLGERKRAVVTGFDVCAKLGDLSRFGSMCWTTADGHEGRSLNQSLDNFRQFGIGTEIDVFEHNGAAVWAGDVGPLD